MTQSIVEQVVIICISEITRMEKSKMNIEAQKKTKIFVLDTNVLLHDPESLMNFGCNDVYLTMGVIGELDKLKSAAGELGNNARQVIR